ncbi:LPXTG cell wall anchor domain-containing protein [Enterococcus hirae]
MKKWLVICTLCGSLVIGSSSIHADTQQDSSSAQTEVTVKLARSILSDQLPGIDGDNNANSNMNSNVNANGNSNSGIVNNQLSIAKPDSFSGNNLPKTNEQIHLFYSILGGIIVGCAICLMTFRKKKEREVED